MALFVVGALLLLSDRVMTGVARAVQAILERRLPRWRAGGATVRPERLFRERDQLRRSLGDAWPQAVATAAGRWIFDFLCLYAALLAVGARPPLYVALLAYCAAQLLGEIPLTPGGLGVVEAGLTGTLALAGVPAAPAALATLAYRLASYRPPAARGPHRMDLAPAALRVGMIHLAGLHRGRILRSTSPAMSRSVRVANARAIEGCQRRSPGTAAPPGSRVDAGRRATVFGIKPPIPDSDAPGRCRAGH